MGLSAKKMGLLVIGLPSMHGNQVYSVNSRMLPFPKIKGVRIRLPIDASVKPIKQPLRRIPVMLMESIKKKLDEMESQEIIQKVVEPSEWTSPMVPVLKDNGEVRICIDMRRPNVAIRRAEYPLPTMDEMLPHFNNARYFTILDIKQAFFQCELHEESRPITTFNTPWGRYRFNRLMFGVNCAPEMFQRTLEDLLSGLKNVVNFIDDILVWGNNEKEHDEALRMVLEKLRLNGVLLNSHKCKYKLKQVEFLGYKLSEKGIAPSEEKISAIQRFRTPSTKEEVRSFLGLITFVGRFIPDLATINEPLRRLTKNDVKFKWEKEQQTAFDKMKNIMANTKTLSYFDKSLQTRLIADASPVGIGCVLIQFKEGEPNIIGYAAKSLTDVESRYCQTEREALALVWGVEKYKHYLLGTDFQLETDHKTLECLFAERSRPCARIERWVLRLQAFRYRVVYRKGSANIADVLSRLSATEPAVPFDEESEAYINAIYESAAIDISEIEIETEKDPVLQKLKIAIDSGDFKDPDLKLYAAFKDEYGYTGNLIIRHTRLIIPTSLRPRLLDICHEGHPGETAMKTRLRTKCWWPKMDEEVKRTVSSCQGCTLVSGPERPEPMIRRQLPDQAWTDVAVDFLGPMKTGEYLMVIVDYFSRYLEIEIMSKITADDLLKRWDKIFTRLGYPRSITMDNGRQFVSKKVDDYCRMKGITTNYTTPYWPQANGEVERQNRSILKRLKISQALYGDWKLELNSFLQMYYSTPHTTTGKTPSELMGRQIRTKIPGIEEIWTAPVSAEFRDRDKHLKQKGKEREDEKRRAKKGDLEAGDTVLQKNQFISDKLTTTFNPSRFTVIDKQGSNVKIRGNEDGRVFNRNVSHLKRIAGTGEEQIEVDETADKRTVETMDQEADEDIGTKDDIVDEPSRTRRKPLWIKDYII